MSAEEEETTASVGVWIGLILLSGLSFYSQAAVTEERFVPALNIIATEFNIPDDVAGATLMAAGASSPELFSSIVALFITHSALGLGTIVGSEIFNQLIICAGAVFAARSGKLSLDRAIVTREVGFYALSIALLLYALHDIEPVEDDAQDHIFISFFDACVLFGGYIVYVLVCANFEAVAGFFSGSGGKDGLNGDSTTSYGTVSKRASIKLPTMPFLKTAYSHEPSSNFQTFERTADGIARREDFQASFGSNVSSFESVRNFLKFSDGNSTRAFQFLVHSERPSHQHELHDIEVNGFEERLSCFLWQRSWFYNKAKFAMHGWDLRWFTFTENKIRSVPDRANFQRHQITYPRFTSIEVDEGRHIIRLVHPKRSYYLMAPSAEILSAVAAKCEKILENEPIQEVETPEPEEPLEQDPESHGSLLDFPIDGNVLDLCFHVLLYPLKFAMHWTIPDVRVLDSQGQPTATIGKALLAAFMCLIWLIVGSYAMVSSLENLADLLDIPAAIVGVTVSAAGTSLPNYVASKVAAEKGFGNMAVSNAFGSNTFNIMVGLGLPWVLYTSFGTHFAPYSGLRNEGILESVIILSVVLLVFILLVLGSGFVLYDWHGYLFVGLYAAYLTYSIGSVYL